MATLEIRDPVLNTQQLASRRLTVRGQVQGVGFRPFIYRLAAELGFSGKGAIHPKQIAAINAVFMPDADTVARARRVIAEFRAADTGLVVIDGKLIEKPVLREMERIVAIAERVEAAR